MRKLFFLTILFWFITSCSVEPKPINFGEDKCDYCTMTIVDKTYATELVTDKGKTYKFDATECMLNYMKENEGEYAHVLTCTRDQQGQLTDANNTYYLMSKNLPSPMGANLTAFSSQTLAQEAQTEFGGEVYTFEEIVIHQKEVKKSGDTHSHIH